MVKKIKILKDLTYFSLIKEAIFSTPNLEATVKDIYGYFTMKYPSVFRESNSFTWKSGIRQVLSRYPELIKTRKVKGMREYLWTYKPLEETTIKNNPIDILINRPIDRPIDRSIDRSIDDLVVQFLKQQQNDLHKQQNDLYKQNDLQRKMVGIECENILNWKFDVSRKENEKKQEDIQNSMDDIFK